MIKINLLKDKIIILSKELIIEYNKSMQSYGECSYEDSIITIKENIKDDIKEEIILHEILHLISDSLGLELTEIQVRCLSSALYDTLKRNGEE